VNGDVTGATSAAAGRGPWTGPLPASLHELRSHKPEWMPCLTGRAPMEPAQPPRAEHVTERGELGASVFGVFAFQPGHTFNALTLDVAPGLKPAVGPWLEDREGATAVRGEREHRLLVGAKPLIEHASDAESLRNVIGRGNTRAVALAPVQDEDGEAIGWLYAEWEHHLVPSAARLTRCAQSWLTAVRRARIASASGASAAHASALADPAQRERRAAGEVFRDIVEQLAIKTHQRRWWGFVPAHESQEAPIDGDPPLELVAEGGEGNGFVPFEPGRKRALARAYVTGGRVDFDEPDARLSILGDAGSGVVFPLAVEGRLAGLLAIESSRKHDFRSNDLDASTALVAAHGLRLRLARFRAWHAARFGFEPWFDARRSDFQDFARHLIVGARAHNPWVLHGARGAGKLVLARWAHFEGATGGGELVVAPCGELTPARLEDLAQRAAGGTLLLDELELANSEVQRELASWIATRRADPKPSTALRLGCTTRVGLQVAAAEGRLRDDLAGSFANFELRVPALRERREEIPALVEHMLRMQAEREGQRPAKPSDEALALLWRQPWPGNLRELESVVFKLALLHPGELLSVEHVHDLRRHFELELVRRLPSRSPNRADLLAALRTTRKSCGRINKTRAAAYLGWDPDTLVLRMREAGIPDDMPQLESAWAASESSTAVAAAADTLRGTGSALDATQLESKKKGPPAVFDASGP
jgi:hypothetical protein